MKKRALYLAAFLIAASCFSSCEGLLSNCKVCSLNYYENDVLTNSVSEAEYCDEELIAVQIAPNEDLGGGVVAKWECLN